MYLRLFVILIFSFSFIKVSSAQKKSKQEKKLARYSEEKQRLRDTLFLFETSRITEPFLSNDWSGGYLSFRGVDLRIQEMDWMDARGNRTRWRELTKLRTYSVFENDAENCIRVSFAFDLLGNSYSATIFHGLDKKSVLTIRNSYGNVVKYSGKLKKR